MKVLFLSIWYPNRYDAMSGLFVRKHALAASRVAQVCVLYTCAHAEVKSFEVTHTQKEGLEEYIVYYPKSNIKIGKLISYLKAYYIGLKRVFKQWGKPDVVHSNVLTRTVCIAYYLKLTRSIPYVIAEHWSRYLLENFSYVGFVRRSMTEFVVRHSACVMPVSKILQEAMIHQGITHCNYRVVSNVVDDFFYNACPVNRMPGKVHLLHVSCFDEPSKHVSGIVKAVYMVWQKRQDFDMTFVGYGSDFDQIKQQVTQLNLLDTVIKMVGEQTPEQVRQWFACSDVFVLFSNYETASVVLAESIVSGIPLISTPVGIAPEIVNSETGLLVPKGDISALVAAIEEMIDHHKEYNHETISHYGEMFSMQCVAKELEQVYQLAIQN